MVLTERVCVQMTPCKSVLALASQALAVACVVASASAQACNAGVQYFSLAGYNTAAVFADGMQMLPPGFVFGDQVCMPAQPCPPARHLQHLTLGKSPSLFSSKCTVVMTIMSSSFIPNMCNGKADTKRTIAARTCRLALWWRYEEVAIEGTTRQRKLGSANSAAPGHDTEQDNAQTMRTHMRACMHAHSPNPVHLGKPLPRYARSPPPPAP